MAVETVIGNLTGLHSEFSQGLENLILLFQILGGVFAVYVVVLIINMIANLRRNKHLKKIIENLEEINKKMNK